VALNAAHDRWTVTLGARSSPTVRETLPWMGHGPQDTMVHYEIEDHSDQRTAPYKSP
jgi:hypothetical protein